MTQYKAEHIVGLRQAIAAANASVQCKKSVFRSCNSGARERSELLSGG